MCIAKNVRDVGFKSLSWHVAPAVRVLVNGVPTMTPRDAEPHAPTILIVDDERPIRELIASILEDEGYQVEQARDGLEAFDLVADADVDLVLSDIRMPNLDGLTLAQCLRRGGHVVPMVLMSAVYADISVPGVRFLAKPFAAGPLCQVVASALRDAGHVEPEPPLTRNDC
jgi:CheY-like chemotaxis protein